ncbi:MAG: TolC family protein [Balneolaceae bacterium]
MIYRIFTLVFLLLSTVSPELYAQERLSLDEAINIGIRNHYGIEIARNSAQIDSNNRTLGNAGFLPTLSANASRSERVEDSRFESEFAEGENTGARSTITNAGATLNWTLFDGLLMFATYDKLGEFEELGRNELRLQMEMTVNQIIASYVNIIRLSDQLNVLEDAVEVSRERVEIAETKLDLGSGSEYELLQARTDLNADRAAVLRERNLLMEARVNLNELLAREVDIEFEVMSDIPLNRTLSYEALYPQLTEQNTDLMLARTEQRIADLEIREIKAERFPEIELNSGYNFSRTEGGGGFLQFNESRGLNIGLTARINLFDGFDNSRRVQNAKINLKNRQLEVEQIQKRISSNFLSTWRTYQNNLELVDLEQDNLSNAEETLDIALERFRLGTISAIEFREAQRAFLAAENRLITAKYGAKLAETTLLRLSGTLEHVAIHPLR